MSAESAFITLTRTEHALLLALVDQQRKTIAEQGKHIDALDHANSNQKEIIQIVSRTAERWRQGAMAAQDACARFSATLSQLPAHNAPAEPGQVAAVSAAENDPTVTP